MDFRFIDIATSYGAYNMALDEAILNLNDGVVLRLYQWDQPTLSLGYSQNSRIGIDENKCNELGIDIVRRITGGQAVLHHKELTYSFICPRNFVPDSIIESYKIISSALLNGLDMIGIKASMKEDEVIKENTAICFQSPSYYEVLYTGKKLIGSAQTRKADRVLQHGSILLDIDFDLLFAVFGVQDAKTKEHVKNRMISIREINPEIDITQVVKAVKKGFENSFESTFIPLELTEQEKEMTQRLADEKYCKHKWKER